MALNGCFKYRLRARVQGAEPGYLPASAPSFRSTQSVGSAGFSNNGLTDVLAFPFHLCQAVQVAFNCGGRQAGEVERLGVLLAFGYGPDEEAYGFLGFCTAAERSVLVGVLVEQDPGEAGDRVALGVIGIDDQHTRVLK